MTRAGIKVQTLNLDTGSEAIRKNDPVLGPQNLTGTFHRGLFGCPVVGQERFCMF